MSSDERIAGLLNRMLSSVVGPRWRLGDMRTLTLAAACLAVVAMPEILFGPDTAGYAQAAETAHVLLLILLALVGLRLPLAPGLAIAVVCEGLLAAARIGGSDTPDLLILTWAVLGPFIVAAMWGLSEHQQRMSEAQSRAAIVTLARAIEANHEGTGEHSDDVVDLAVEVGRRMGMAGRDLVDLELAAQLHDVGKIGVPQSILDKPGPLDDGEAAVIRRHPDIGADLVDRLPWLAPLATHVRAMHERWDGDGYPHGLAGRDIPRLARIVFACDAYSAMRQDRPYRRARSHAEAVAELRRCAGTQFDPDVVAALEAVLEPAAGGRPADAPRPPDHS